jgi:hypothetical protein
MPCPTLYQIHTRDWLWRLSQSDRLITLDQIPDGELDRLTGFGFNWLYLLGVWQTGEAGREMSAQQASHAEYDVALPGWQQADVVGSPFAVVSYDVHRDFGGNTALSVLRERLRKRGIRLILDFVANHTAIDHPWAHEQPDYYVSGTEDDLAREPQNYIRLNDGRIVAHGRDPYFPGWSDTLQLNYGNAALRSAMRAQLVAISQICDGVRCDMAMLILPEIFKKTWSIETAEFWTEAIRSAREQHPDFLLMAEVYWGLEWELQQRGFDFTYDKELLDRLLERNADRVHGQLMATPEFQAKSARFLENHDEQRIAAILPVDVHKAAAILTYLVPGLHFFHDGQLSGYLRKPNIHLAHRAPEPPNPDFEHLYKLLLNTLPEVCRDRWQLLTTGPAWEGNLTFRDLICFNWFQNGRPTYLIAVNYADHPSQCYVNLPLPLGSEGVVVLEDRMGHESYRREIDQIRKEGLYLALPAWGYNVFQVTPSDS